MNSKDAKKLRKFFAKLEEMKIGLPEMWQEAPAYYYKKAGEMDYEELPLSNLFVTMLQRLGVETESFADSTGTISEV